MVRQLAATIALFFAAQAAPTLAGRDAPPHGGTPSPANLSESVVRRPVVFEPNVGQFDAGVRYRADGAGMSLALTDAAAVLSLGAEPGSRRQIRITPVSAAPSARPSALDRLAGVVNHFEDAAPSEWHAGVPTYGRVRYPGVYPGIDLVYHGSPDELEYDFVVGRGADPSRIAVRFDGAERVEIDAGGDLLIHVGDAVVRQRAPYAWQEQGQTRRRVDAAYRLTKAGDVAFTIGSYDRRRPLVIDPILLYSTYLHARSSRVAIDPAGYLIVVTERTLTGDATTGIKVERLTPDGQTSVYATLIGSDFLPVAGVAATPNGEAVVVGSTSSSNFPLVNAAQGYPGDAPFSNAFVVKLDATGGFVFSTYLGGLSTDGASGVSVNQAGTIAVAGYTSSADFPGIDGLRLASGDAGFVTVFSANGSRLHGALLPANSGGATGVAVDATGMVYVAAGTFRNTWPTTPGAFQTAAIQGVCGDSSLGPCLRGVLAKLSPNLGSLVYSTYLHTLQQPLDGAEVRVTALGVDGTGAAYILGSTTREAFGGTSGVLQPHCPTNSCSFLAKLNPAGSGLAYSTFLPSFPTALQVDARGNAYLTGTAYFSGGPIPTTPTAQQPQPADAQLFVTADGGATWRPKPPSEEVSGAAVGHGTGPMLYTTNYLKGLFRSTDLGDHWTQVEGGTGTGTFTALFVAPNNPNIMYEPSDRLVRRSSDGGATWSFVSSPIPARAFAVDPVDAQTVYVGGTAAVFKSVNGGITWSSASNGIGAGTFVDALLVAPSNHNVLFAKVSRFVPTEFYGLYRSGDGGANWTLVSPLTSRFVGPVAVDPLDATRVYACSDGRIMRTTDSGGNWSIFANVWCTAIAVTRTPAPTVFAATADGIGREVDTGGTFSTLSLSLGNGGVHQLSVDPVSPDVMMAVTYSGGDAFVWVLDPAGTKLRYASYFGGADSESSFGIALGAGGAVAVTGWTWSRDLPLVNPRFTDRAANRLDSFVALMRIPLPTVVLDAPAGGSMSGVFNVSGWAIDSGAAEGAGIDAVHVWAFPENGGAPVFVGAASYGAPRPDIAGLFGAQFTNSGFSLTGGRLPPGAYKLAAFARSTVSLTFDSDSRSVQVVDGARMNIDSPAPGVGVFQPLTIAGWALDQSAPAGTGIDAVHVWAYPDGGAPLFVGVATYGVDRPDVAAAFGSRFGASGFTLEASGLAPGSYTLAVVAHSSLTFTFNLVRTVRVHLPDGGAAAIDTPAPSTAVSTPFVVSGWAIDRQGAGTGVDAVHIWAVSASGGPAVFLGAAASVSRPDVAAVFGDSRFESSGYSLTVNTLPQGTYTVLVYARSVATGGFSIVRSVQVVVR